MSGYPYGYPFPGQPPPSQQQYPPNQPYGAYAPPANGFGTTTPQSQQLHYAPPTNGYYANMQSAYDYNASSIPGLSTPSSGHPPLPISHNGVWNQGGYGIKHAASTPLSSAPVTYPHPHKEVAVAQAPPPAIPTHATKSSTQNETAPKPRPRAEQPKAEQPKLLGGNAEVQEEGEIDDGYFDDLYDDASKAPSVIDDTGAIATKPLGDLVEDNSDQEPNFYDTEIEDVPVLQKPSEIMVGEKRQDRVKLQGQPDRDRSRSYSPHLSPTEIRGGSLSLHEHSTNSCARTSSHEQRGTTAEANIPSSISTQDGGRFSKNGTDGGAPVAAETKTTTNKTTTGFTSVSEASNEAKKAILRLLPHGVKFQTYIDEGFDAVLVKDLFTQLNLPTDSASSAATEKPPAAQVKTNQTPGSEPSQQTQSDTLTKKQEERKDKIARLMAEKKAKLAAASISKAATAGPSGGKSGTSIVSVPPAKPPVTRADKDRLLQQKVEALRNKAREAKKLAQKPATSQTPKPDAAQHPTPPHVSLTTTESPVTLQPTSGTPLSSASQSTDPSPAASTLASVPRAPQINPRKRPVAADFMDYPPLPIKRPSLADRQNASFVISISDDEDDDDVEMEVESVTEDSQASLPQTMTLTRRGPSIRDFPPLSNIKNTRQTHSPVSGSSTLGAKNANADLETKERAILEMQRKIKELEAKKEAKARSGSGTPRSPSAGGIVLPEQAVQTPIRRVGPSSDADDKTTPSAQLLQEAEAARAPAPKTANHDPQKKDEQSVKVPNAQLLAKSAKALEKAERLRRMQEEMQKLQAEIDQEDDEVEVEVEVEEQRTSEEADVPAQIAGAQLSQGMLASTGHESDRGAQVKRAESLSATTSEEGQTPSKQDSTDAEAMQIDSSPDPSDYSATAAPSHATILMDQFATHASTLADAGKLPDDLDLTSSLPPLEAATIADLGESDGYEPPEPKVDGRVGVDSQTFHSAPIEVAHPTTQQRGEVAEMTREAVTDTVPSRQPSFAPYESPLRYYHAYRFHPNYNNGIQGGLKSLTYSNRIDPNKEMCPEEWEGNDCPRGDACQFQHFQSIIAPDSEIILELGSSDEFTGDQKREFNNGLREVVTSFQKSKVRDFRTIAQAIVDFRHRFLGDPSKVLRLDGVSI